MAEDSIAILGGKGMLGTDLTEICAREGYDVRVLDLPEFDVTDSRRMREALAAESTIVNCAAYTDVDGAESEAELAHRVNAEAVGRLGSLARETGAWLLHISTDFVFDGELDRPYVETDTPNPISEYGRSKLAGERLLAESDCAFCILRLEWTYGLRGRNFVTKLVERAKADGKLKVVDDQIGSPTATTEAGKAICELLRRRPEGVFHFANAGYASRYEIAEFVFDKVPVDVDLSPCKTSDLVSPAQRPLNSRFDCSKITSVLGEPIPPWQVPLEGFLRRL
ncbi:MAG: dTDP-4-dehydrorhamnose reductase [Phycisphaerales bacterium]|nr:MAG: dTDP-4-dehydrorhamnose reductase [Phycisphaerales bacterium]